MSNWYLIHIKIRQERCALKNLERQGFESSAAAGTLWQA